MPGTDKPSLLELRTAFRWSFTNKARIPDALKTLCGFGLMHIAHTLATTKATTVPNQGLQKLALQICAHVENPLTTDDNIHAARALTAAVDWKNTHPGEASKLRTELKLLLNLGLDATTSSPAEKSAPRLATTSFNVARLAVTATHPAVTPGRS